MFIYEKAPFPSCHASSIVEVEPGKFLATWFGGTAEKAKDVKIWLSKFDGKKWSDLELMAEEPNIPTWNPVLFLSQSKTLFLWYKAGPDPQTWSGFVRKSTDLGKTWSKSEILPAGLLGPVRAKPLQLADGTILAGSSVESYRAWTCYVDRSKDDGKTWQRFGPISLASGGHHLIQPSLIEAKDGRIIAFMRSRGQGKICRSESKDQGQTWSAAEPIAELPNPNSGIDCVKTKSGDLWMLYNHTNIARTPLCLALSKDDGKTWKTQIHTLEKEFGEFSYPALIESSTGTLEMTYTWKRTHIKYVSLDPKVIGKEG
jgi:predicted neuraminidase